MKKIKLYLLPGLLLFVLSTFILSSLFMFYQSMLGILPLLLLFGISGLIFAKINKLLESTPHVQHVNMRTEHSSSSNRSRKTLTNVKVKDL